MERESKRNGKTQRKDGQCTYKRQVEREKEERNKIWKGKVKGTARHREKTGNVRMT